MESATQDLYYQKLNELIVDEDQIVTCSSIAFKLRIPLSESRTLLAEYAKDHLQLKPDQFTISYLLSGTLKGNKGLALYLTSEKDLEQKRSQFDEVACEFVYSVQKSKSLKSNIIALAEDVDSEELLEDLSSLNLIAGKNCRIRNVTKKKVIIPEPKATTSKANSFFTKIAKQEDKIEEVKAVETPKETISQPVLQTKQTNKHKPKGSISSFFSKIPPKSNTTVEAKPIESKSIKLEKEERKSEVNEEKSVSSAKENAEVERGKPPISKEKKNEKKRKKPNKNDEKPTKRRKRIQVISDSDSDDIFGDGENEDVEKSDEEPQKTVPSKPTVLPPKNKKRKAVDRTYEDEDGFIVTTTEYVYESASEEEEVKPPEKKPEILVEKKPEILVEKKPEILVEKKKNSTTDSENDTNKATSKGGKKAKKEKANNGKQPTLLNFFKKM